MQATELDRCPTCDYPLDYRPDEYGVNCVQPCKVCALKSKTEVKRECDDCPYSPVIKLQKELAEAKKDVSFWQKKWNHRNEATK